MIGIGAVVRAALRGAKVIAVDIDDTKLALAKQLGSTFTINSKTEIVYIITSTPQIQALLS